MEFPNGEGACAGASAGALREFGEGEIDWTGVEDRKVISIIPELGPFYTVTFDLFLNSIQDVRDNDGGGRFHGFRPIGNILDFKKTAISDPSLMGIRWAVDKPPFKVTFNEESDHCKRDWDPINRRKLNWNEKDKNRLCIPSGKVPRPYLTSVLTFKLSLPWYVELPELTVSQFKFKKQLEIKKWHKIEFTRRQLGKSNWNGLQKFCYVSLKVNGVEVDGKKIGCTGKSEERYKNVTMMSGNHNMESKVNSFIPDMKIKNLKSTNLADTWPKKD